MRWWYLKLSEEELRFVYKSFQLWQNLFETQERRSKPSGQLPETRKGPGSWTLLRGAKKLWWTLWQGFGFSASQPWGHLGAPTPQTCTAPRFWCVLSLGSHQLCHPWKKQYALQNARHPSKLPLASTHLGGFSLEWQQLDFWPSDCWKCTNPTCQIQIRYVFPQPFGRGALVSLSKKSVLGIHEEFGETVWKWKVFKIEPNKGTKKRQLLQHTEIQAKETNHTTWSCLRVARVSRIQASAKANPTNWHVWGRGEEAYHS